MDICHRLSEVLRQFDDVSLPTLQRLLDFFMESGELSVFANHSQVRKLPRIDVNITKLEFLHDVFQRREATRDVFWLVTESFDEPGLVLFAE